MPPNPNFDADADADAGAAAVVELGRPNIAYAPPTTSMYVQSFVKALNLCTSAQRYSSTPQFN